MWHRQELRDRWWAGWSLAGATEVPALVASAGSPAAVATAGDAAGIIAAEWLVAPTVAGSGAGRDHMCFCVCFFYLPSIAYYYQLKGIVQRILRGVNNNLK